MVEATDTSTHYLPIDDNGTFIPDDDDFVVISVPEGIDSIDFVPAGKVNRIRAATVGYRRFMELVEEYVDIVEAKSRGWCTEGRDEI